MNVTPFRVPQSLRYLFRLGMCQQQVVKTACPAPLTQFVGSYGTRIMVILIGSKMTVFGDDYDDE